MACVQIIEMHTKDYEPLQALGGEFFAAPRASAPRNLPETAAFAENADAAARGAPTFYDLDVIEDRA